MPKIIIKVGKVVAIPELKGKFKVIYWTKGIAEKPRFKHSFHTIVHQTRLGLWGQSPTSNQLLSNLSLAVGHPINSITELQTSLRGATLEVARTNQNTWMVIRVLSLAATEKKSSNAKGEITNHTNSSCPEKNGKPFLAGLFTIDYSRCSLLSLNQCPKIISESNNVISSNIFTAVGFVVKIVKSTPTYYLIKSFYQYLLLTITCSSRHTQSIVKSPQTLIN